MTPEKNINYDVIPLFNYPLYKGVSEVSEKIIEYAKGCSYPNGTLSEKSILPLDIVELESAITPHVNNYFYNVLNFSDSFKYKFADGWFIKVEPGSGPSNSHIHSNSLFSGVFYLHVTENSGDIFFSKRIFNNSYSITVTPPIKETNIFNASGWLEKPFCGRVLLFPSSLEHTFHKNNSDFIRLSYAFNIVPTGLIDPRVGSALKYD